MRIVFLIALAVISTGCNSLNPQLADGPDAAIALTGGPNTSMIYLARTDSGVVAIDLGWWGQEKSFAGALARLGAKPPDVKMVFLTHSHRDHIAGWRRVRGARFLTAESERPLLLGTARHHGWIVRLTDRLNPPALPDSIGLDLRTFAGDTTFVLGRDTLRAYVVPGHTAGSAVYLFRGILFLGDAVTYSPLGGFKPAKPGFTDNRTVAAASLLKLLARVRRNELRVICTAHAECAAFTPELEVELKRNAGVVEPAFR